MQVELVHCLPGRLRMRLPALRGNLRHMQAIDGGLRSAAGMRVVQSNPWTGTLLVTFNPQRFTPQAVLRLVVSLARVERPTGARSSALAAVAEATAAAAEVAAATSAEMATEVGSVVPDSAGLDDREAARRLQQLGPNVLPAPRPAPFWRRFLGQFTDLPTLILFAGTALSALAGRTAQMLAVGIATGVNALVGAWREGHTDPAHSALHAMTPPAATVVRSGRVGEVPAAELVPGDLILLTAGDRVPADVLLVEATDLELSESQLPDVDGPGPHAMANGGFIPVGSDVLRGHARAVVVATGPRTTLGQLAGSLAANRRLPSPVQRRASRLARDLLRIAAFALTAVTVIGMLRGAAPLALLQSGLSVAAAALPEGLPTFMTLALAAGARRLARRGAYVRDLATAETVGAVTVICADKTGTLTRGEMTVRTIFTGNAWWTVTGGGFDPTGQFTREGELVNPLKDQDMRMFLEIAVRCNNASLVEGADGELTVNGSQTEGAMLVLAIKAGLPREIGREPRMRERAFDPVRRSMTMTYDLAGAPITCSKGAPEAILPKCTRMIIEGSAQPIQPEQRAAMQSAVHSLAAGGHRVLALAYRYGDEAGQGLTFAGLLGIVDPPRRELRPVIRRIEQAHIRTVMLTGDHPETAGAVGHELGLLDGRRRLVTGDELKRLDDRQLGRIVRLVGVFARVTPEQKARIIRVLQRKGETVAFIGDGIDDAAAVRVADIGVVPRERAAEVTRESASIIVSGDRFETLVTAIEQGQGTAVNSSEITRYLLTSNMAEIVLLLASAIFGLPLALLPLQVIWLNLIANGPAAIALGERHVHPARGVSTVRRPVERLEQEILVQGLQMGAAAFALYITTLASGGSLAVAQTLALGAMATGQMLYLFRCRTDLGTPCGLRVPTEPAVLLAATTTGLLLLASLYFPPLAAALGTVPLTMPQWLTVAGAGVAANLSAVAAFSLRPEAVLPAPTV